MLCPASYLVLFVSIAQVFEGIGSIIIVSARDGERGHCAKRIEVEVDDRICNEAEGEYSHCEDGYCEGDLGHYNDGQQTTQHDARLRLRQAMPGIKVRIPALLSQLPQDILANLYLKPHVGQFQ